MKRLSERHLHKSQESLDQLLSHLHYILMPAIQPNSIYKTEEIQGWYFLLPELIARIINQEFILSEDLEIQQFGADDIVPLQIISNENKEISIWGRIYWLEIAPKHKTYRNWFKDPFFCKMSLSEKEITTTQVLFADFDKIDIETDTWINHEVNWKYELSIDLEE